MLKTNVESIDDLPESVQEHYQEVDGGGYVLQAELPSGYKLENVDGLASTLNRQKTELRSLKEKLKGFDGLDPQEARSALDRVAELKDAPDDRETYVQQKTEKLNGQLTDLRKQLEEVSREKSALESAITQRDVKDVAKDTMRDLGVEQKILGPHVYGALKPIDDEGTPRVVAHDSQGSPILSKKTPGSYMDAAEYIESFREDPVLKVAFPASGQSGGGTRTTAKVSAPDKNPWAEGSRNLTEQMRIQKSDPQLAAELMAAAGASE